MPKEEAISTDESIEVIDEKDKKISESSQLNEIEENVVDDEAMDNTSNTDYEKYKPKNKDATDEEEHQALEDKQNFEDSHTLDKNESPENESQEHKDQEHKDQENEDNAIGETSSEINEMDDLPVVEVEEKVKQQAPEESSNKSYGFVFMFFLIILVGGAGSAGAYYFWQQQLKQAGSMQRQASSMRQQAGAMKQQAGTMKQQANDMLQQAAEIREQARLISRQQQSISTLQTQLELTNSNFNDSTQLSADNAVQIQGLDDKIKQAERVSQKAIDVVNRNQRDWALAEINYLLRMAHQRLAIAKDVKSSIAALKGADERIEQLGDLSLFKVRKQLAIDIGYLNAIQEADVNGVSLALDQAISSIKSLPFISVKEEMKGLLVEQEISALETEGVEVVVEEKTILEQIIEAVKELGEIKVHQKSVITANSAEEQGNIEQILRMHLLAARLAALQFEQKQFVYELNQAEQLLDTHYDRGDARIQQLQQMLKDYSTLELNPDLPELTKAWTLLQTEMKKAKAIMATINAEQKKSEL